MKIPTSSTCNLLGLAIRSYSNFGFQTTYNYEFCCPSVYARLVCWYPLTRFTFDQYVCVHVDRYAVNNPPLALSGINEHIQARQIGRANTGA